MSVTLADLAAAVGEYAQAICTVVPASCPAQAASTEAWLQCNGLFDLIPANYCRIQLPFQRCGREVDPLRHHA